MSETIDIVKDLYIKGVFPESWLNNLLDKGKITKEEYDTIIQAKP